MLFYREHFLQSERDSLRVKFERLELDTMTVAEYHAEFTRLVRFAPCICATDVERAKRFADGLHLNILEPIATTTFRTLSSFVDAAIRMEVICIYQEKRRADPTRYLDDQRARKRQHSLPDDQRAQQTRANRRNQRRDYSFSQIRQTRLAGDNVDTFTPIICHHCGC